MILVENWIRINRTLLEKILPDLEENFFSTLRLIKGNHLRLPFGALFRILHNGERIRNKNGSSGNSSL